MTIKIGDVVWLKSGSPAFTVVKVSLTEAVQAEVRWVNDTHELKTAHLPVEAVTSDAQIEGRALRHGFSRPVVQGRTVERSVVMEAIAAGFDEGATGGSDTLFEVIADEVLRVTPDERRARAVSERAKRIRERTPLGNAVLDDVKALTEHIEMRSSPAAVETPPLPELADALRQTPDDQPAVALFNIEE